ncbi:MAG: hypothetical protein HOY79_48325 [Streptomyces sp.]|nr:hypothetical protein [Streptomyces sp.]
MVWRKAAEDEAAGWKAEADRQRKRADQAEKSLKTEIAARRRATELYSELFDEHERVTSRNVLLCAQVEDAKAAVFDEAKAKESAERIARLQEAVSEARAEARTEKRRAEHLQKRLDDAVGLPVGRIEDSRPWQPAFQEPKEDAS